MHDDDAQTSEQPRRPIPVRVALGQIPPSGVESAPPVRDDGGALAGPEPRGAGVGLDGGAPAVADAAGAAAAVPAGGATAGSKDTGQPRRRPTPVREILARRAPGAGTPWPVVEEVRRFHVDGTEWIARVAGRSLYGTGSTPRARLMIIEFCRAEAPDTPVRRMLVPGRSLEQVWDEELGDLLQRAEAVEDQARRGRESRIRAHRRRRGSSARERGGR